jgi:hypothetical protein
LRHSKKNIPGYNELNTEGSLSPGSRKLRSMSNVIDKNKSIPMNEITENSQEHISQMKSSKIVPQHTNGLRIIKVKNNKQY